MTTYVFTSATLGYLPKVRVLAESVKAHDPEASFCLLLGELGPAALPGPAPECDEIVTLDSLGIPDLKSWVFKHSVVELCTAIKAVFLKRLLARPDCEAVFYFDPDIVLFTDLGTLAARFADGPILLTPHLTSPETSLDAIADNEIAALKHGVFNLGFLAVKASPEGKAFADWWWTRLKHFCRVDIAGGLFTDQRWIDLAPAFFPDTVIVRDPNWNVATWNLGGRTIEGTLRSGLRVGDLPVLFYHFSGLDSGAQLAMLRKYGGGMKGLFELRDWYLNRCRELGGGDDSAIAWSLDAFDSGEPIRPEHRYLYRDRPDLQKAFPDPFAVADPARSYLHWFAEHHGVADPAEEGEASRLLAIYRSELERILRSRSWRALGWLRKLVG
jgi:hypothetical protein